MESFFRRFRIRKDQPTLAHLVDITRALSTIPYENVTKILALNRGEFGIPLLENHLRYGTGGTCFSATRFAFDLLSACGFTSYPVMADRSYGPNTHCTLVVDLEGGKFLVDPAFLVPEPVPLSGGGVFTGFNFFRLSSRQGSVAELSAEYETWTCHRGSWKFRYRFCDEPVSWEEFFGHWQDSFKWKGMNSVVITTVRDARQFYLHNRHLRIIERNRVIRSTITPTDLPVVSKIFGIDGGLVRDAFEITGSIR